MNKIWMITFKDVRETFTDRNLILLMLVTPVVLSTIIALAFSDLTGDSAPIQDIPVALVNLDEGTTGDIFVTSLTGESSLPPDAQADDQASCAPQDADPDAEAPPNTLLDLTNTTLLDDADTARAGVDDGTYAAAVIIPVDYSQSVAYRPFAEIQPAPVEVYGDSNRSISADVVFSVVESINNQILTGQIAIATTVDGLIERGLDAESVDPCTFSAAFDPDAGLVDVAALGLTGDQPEEVNLLVVFGAAQAAFFALFTASGAASSILEERRFGTLQRMVVSPTPRIAILLGKLFGVFASVLLQLVFLFIAFTVVASLIEGQVTYIWGTNWLAIIAMVVVTSLAASGVGMFVGALSSNAEQAGIIGGVVAIFMGLMGGAFFQFGELPDAVEALTRLSIVRWGSEGFTKLAEGSSDILLNLVALLLIGAGLFFISLFVFNRREDI